MNINVNDENQALPEESKDQAQDSNQLAEQPAPTDNQSLAGTASSTPSASDEALNPQSPAPATENATPPFHPTIPLELPAGRKSLIHDKRALGLLGALAVLIVIALFVVMPSNQTKPLSDASKTGNTNNLSKIPSTNSVSPSTNSTVLPAGTDNTSLNNDLNNISSSMNQESSDQNSSNSSLNDSSQQITVPTN
ncbi:MAG TPA: hypothetical protein VFN31_02505 [Candidatus Saccharimonadales bacterium]|nr:hypothetical protein [Candidatus Saccharimonadales bacterium]